MTKALLIVDVQYDFCEGGSMGVDGGLALANKIAEWLPETDYDYIVTTQDNHIEPGAHFSTNPDFIDSWPVHCKAGTHGAKIVEPLGEMIQSVADLMVTKGEYEAAYSGFEGTARVNWNGVKISNSDFIDLITTEHSLDSALRHLKVDELDVVGIALDYCVAQTAIDAAKNGFKTTVLKDFTVGISEEKINETLKNDFPNNGVEVS